VTAANHHRPPLPPDLTESTPLISVPADCLAETVAVLDGLTYALAITPRDFDGVAADAADSVAGVRAALARDARPAVPMEAHRRWRAVLAGALHGSTVSW
jgi:hypothetical protein